MLKYTTWPKICGHLPYESVGHPISEPWAWIWSRPPPHFAAVTASTRLGRLSTRFWSVSVGNLCPFSRKTICKVRHWCCDWRYNFSQRFSVGLRSVVCAGLSSSSTTNLSNHAPPCLVHRGTVMLEQERDFPKLFPQSWKHTIVSNVFVCCWSINVILHWN